MWYNKSMGEQAVFKDRKRGHEEAPRATPLSESMGQGGGYRNGAPTCGLACQMQQGSCPKHSFNKDKPPTLGSLMGQR